MRNLFQAAFVAGLVGCLPLGAFAQCVGTDLVTLFIGPDGGDPGDGEPAVEVSGPSLLECEGVITDPIAPGPTVRRVNILDGAVVATPGDAIQLGDRSPELHVFGSIKSGGDAITGQSDMDIFATGEIVAEGDGIRYAIQDPGADTAGFGGFIDVRDIKAGGTAINLGQASFGFVTFSDLEAGEFGVRANNGLSVFGGVVDGQDGASAVTVGDTIHIGRNAFVGFSANDGRYVARATGEGAAVISVEDGQIFLDGPNVSITSEKSAAIRFRGGVETFSSATLVGSVSGVIGIDAAMPVAATQSIFVSNDLTGTGGIAADLGGGSDQFLIGGFEGRGFTITGDVLLGDQDDQLVFYKDPGSVVVVGESAGEDGGLITEVQEAYGFAPTGPIMSEGSIFDGGDDTDLVTFETITSMAIVGAVLNAPNDVTLSLDFAGVVLTNRFVNFERFIFTDREMDINGLVSSVPLPAPALMLGAALAGLGGVARRSGGAGARRG